MPAMVRWPGHIKPGTVTNELMAHLDWMPTLASIAGEPDLVNKLKAGYTANGINYKVHLDGYDQSKFLESVSGTAANNNGVKSARSTFFYSNDDGLLVAMRKGDYKYVFSEQRKEGTMGVWAEPSTTFPCRRSSTSCRHRSSGPTSPPTPSGIGRSTTSQHVRRDGGVSSPSLRRSRNSRRAPPAEFSIRRISLERRWTTYKTREMLKKNHRPRAHSRRAQQDDRKADAGAGAVGRLQESASKREA